MKKIFYGWRIVAAGAMFNALIAGLMNQSFGSYFATLSEEKGWSKTALSGAYTMMPIEGAIMGPVLGWAIDRFGARRMIRFGVILFGIGFMLLSQIDTLPQLYGALFCIALGSSFSGHFPMNIVIIHWFERFRARALSSVSLGVAAGGLIVPVVAWSMHTWGWRWTAFASGVIIIIGGLYLASMVHSRPSDIGETVDGEPPAPPPEPGKAAPVVRRDFTAREALRTSAFWYISLGHGFALFAVVGVNVHSITHMKESLGYSLAHASIFFTFMLAAQFAGVITGWFIGDRWQKRYIAAVCMGAHMVGLIMLAFATGPLMLIVFGALHGWAWGLRGPFMQAIRADYFGRKEIGMIIGISAMIIVIGQIGGPMVAGVTADLTGNYKLGFTILALLAGMGSVFFLLAKPPKHRTAES